LKSYFYYLLLVIGAKVSRTQCVRAGGANTIREWASSTMVAYLHATAETILMDLAVAALGLLVEAEGVEWGGGHQYFSSLDLGGVCLSFS
jgi:hypothetical protein